MPTIENAGRRVVIVVEGAGNPTCVVVPWEKAREHLIMEFHGEMTEALAAGTVREEVERWTHFSDDQNWSIDDEGQPFGYVQECANEECTLRAFFVAKAGDYVSLSDFYDMLQRHDWYYAMSDDGRVYRAGDEAMRKLSAIALQSGAHKALMRAFHEHYFTGKPWGNEQKPLPELPPVGVSMAESFVKLSAEYATLKQRVDDAEKKKEKEPLAEKPSRVAAKKGRAPSPARGSRDVEKGVRGGAAKKRAAAKRPPARGRR